MIIPQIKEIESLIQSKNQEVYNYEKSLTDLERAVCTLNEQINNYKNSISKLYENIKNLKEDVENTWESHDVCPRCKGSKEIFKRSCAEDDGDYYKCGRCNGTGKYKEAKNYYLDGM